MNAATRAGLVDALRWAANKAEAEHDNPEDAGYMDRTLWEYYNLLQEAADTLDAAPEGGALRERIADEVEKAMRIASGMDSGEWLPAKADAIEAITNLIDAARAEGRREGMEEAARIAGKMRNGYTASMIRRAADTDRREGT